MDWLKAIYGVVGAEYPILSLAVASLVGAILFGGAWWLVGREYRQHHPAVVARNETKPVGLPSSSTAAGGDRPSAAQEEGRVIAPPAGAAPVKPGPDTSQRVFTTRSVRELMALYEGRTMLQADALIEPYKGLWISITATADQIIPDTSGATVVLRSGQDLVNARFDNSWRKALGRVNTGETITIRGRLGDVQNGQQLYLIQCEIGDQRS